MSNSIVLFLDFDGTLHPLWTGVPGVRSQTVRTYDGPWLTEAAVLQEIIAPYEGLLKIVISSVWAKRMDLVSLRALFPAALRAQVTDALWSPDEPASDAALGKFAAIAAWIYRTGFSGQWIALDDDARGWPSDYCDRLILASGTLAQPSVQARLRDRLALLCHGLRDN